MPTRITETYDSISDASGGFLSRVSWGSILLGTVVALGTMLLLSLLGIALGFSVVDPATEADPLAGIPTGTAIYTAIAYIIALAIGGFAAARLASSAWSSAAVLHGATVWALAALLTVFAATSGVSALISGTTAIISTISGGAAKAAQAVVPEDMDLPDFRDFRTLIPNDFVQTLPQEIQESLQQNDVTLEDIQREGRDIIRELISEEEQQQAREAVTDAATSIVQNPGQATQEIEQLMDELFGPNGLISEEDRQEAARMLEERLGISPEEVEAIMAQMQETMDEVAQTVEDTLNEIRQQAAELAQQATDAIASAAWWAFIISVLGLLAAIGGALVGRPKDLHH